MSKARLALLLISLTPVAPPAVLAGSDTVTVSTVRGCCACHMCADAEQCIDGATLTACNETCVASGCQRITFSLSGSCEDGCRTSSSRQAEGEGSDQ